MHHEGASTRGSRTDGQPPILEVNGLFLTLVGLVAGTLFGATMASILVTAAGAESEHHDWLPSGLPGTPGPAGREPQGATGSQETDVRRPETGAARTPGPHGRPTDVSTCDGSRSGPRTVRTAPRPTPTPPRRDRRAPSVGWARLRHDPCSSRRRSTKQWSWG
jgi:hypothetical protein